jgi:hypothetical protein
MHDPTTVKLTIDSDWNQGKEAKVTLYFYTEVGLVNKSSSLAPPLGIVKFTIAKDANLFTLCCTT